MHLSPAAREGAIRRLNRPDDGAGLGEIVETHRAARRGATSVPSL
jgi:hypothetical protein